ncbi:hypothetical protein [Micropruina sp.]|uniref:hypothetical protein n=1 Tax=Micropruina sp. TaxID=2737536 RepID=UPI0039E621CE
MPKPNWPWFMVAVVAAVTCFWLIQSGHFTQSASGPPGGWLFAPIALLAVWAFGRAFFNFRLPPSDKS